LIVTFICNTNTQLTKDSKFSQLWKVHPNTDYKHVLHALVHSAAPPSFPKRPSVFRTHFSGIILSTPKAMRILYHTSPRTIFKYVLLGSRSLLARHESWPFSWIKIDSFVNFCVVVERNGRWKSIRFKIRSNELATSVCFMYWQ